MIDDQSASGKPRLADQEHRWKNGWLDCVEKCASPNHGPRPIGTAVNLIVVHSISLPPGVFGGDEIERLFTNRLDWDSHPYFQAIRGIEVSSHFLVHRDGRLRQFVSCDDRAWHAGQSCWLDRSNCNDYSIGIELEGLEGGDFEPVQYARLAGLIEIIKHQYPIEHIAGHEHVAEGRKFDPGPGFDWQHLQQLLCWPHQCFPDVVACQFRS